MFENIIQSAMVGAVRDIATAGLNLVQRRIELAAAELQEEKKRTFELLLGAAALAALGSITLALLTITLVVAFWETARVQVLCGLTATFVSATFWLYCRVKKAFVMKVPFSKTVHQLKQDQEALANR